ncbi:hypothetical protein FIBSPDRAFT_923918 [Athelia psychrophila]|uniref:Uncharacterized protein n=1 Tax=Athelia psychrophila TaxID=1759441 RepID=A0A166X3Z3_9AGAM|nr:hypothetical protein FIBSPDRAFT_923918 [Fibularhizoctonia sp. CBS 109695]
MSQEQLEIELIVDNDERTGFLAAVDSWDKHLGPGGVHIGEGGGGGVMGLGVESMRDLNQYLKSKLILLGNLYLTPVPLELELLFHFPHHPDLPSVPTPIPFAMHFPALILVSVMAAMSLTAAAPSAPSLCIGFDCTGDYDCCSGHACVDDSSSSMTTVLLTSMVSG